MPAGDWTGGETGIGRRGGDWGVDWDAHEI
jgi:hypothetical protein